MSLSPLLSAAQLADTNDSQRLTYRQFVHLLLLSSRARLQDRLKFSYMLHIRKEKTLEAWQRHVQERQKRKEAASNRSGMNCAVSTYYISRNY